MWLTIAPSHEQVAHVHDQSSLEGRGVDEVTRPARVLDLQSAARVLEEHGDGAPVRVCGHYHEEIQGQQSSRVAAGTRHILRATALLASLSVSTGG